MRWLTLLGLLFNVVLAAAQCCCSDILLTVPVVGFAGTVRESDYVVKYDSHRVSLADNDSTDHALSFRMDAGCGVAERTLTIIRRSTQETMELHVLFVGFDGAHPGLRVPFLPGFYEVDFNRLRDGGDADRYEDLMPNDTATFMQRTVQCGPCRLLVQRDKHGVTLEPLDLRTGGCGPGRVEPGVIGLASCPGGQIAFQQGVQELLQKGLDIRAAGTLLYSGIASVNERGGFHGRMHEEQTDLVYNLELALMRGPDWSPSWMYDAEAPGGARNIDSMVRFTLIKGADRAK